MYRRDQPDTVKRYILNIIIVVFDVFPNVLMGGAVRTISERIGQIKAEGKLDKFPIERFIDKYVLEKLDPGHSLRAYEVNK